MDQEAPESAEVKPEDSGSPPAREGPAPWILYGIIGAIFVGALLGGLAPDFAIHLALLGELFMSALKMIVVPLIMVSMICGVSALGDIRRLGSLGSRTVIYYLATTGASVLVGIILVNLIRPGDGIPHGESLPQAPYTVEGQTLVLSEALQRRGYEEGYEVALTVEDQVVLGAVTEVDATRSRITVAEWLDEGGEAVLPPAAGAGVELRIATSERIESKKTTAGEAMASLAKKLVPENIVRSMVEMDILPLITFSLLFGAALTMIGSKGQPAIDFFQAANAAIMRMVHIILYIAPIGILGLIAARIGKAGGFEGFMPELRALGAYFATVIAGLTFHAFVTLALILRLVGKRRPTRYARTVAPALLNAFSTASSSATLPITTTCVERGGKVSPRIAGFVLPLGATINMDGTALYEAVAAIFVAQAFNVELTTFHMVIIFLTATLASIGAAGIPEAGLVTMVMVLTAVGLPLEGITLILTVDWLLDRFRTTVNVWGDSIGAASIDVLETGAQPPQSPT